MVDLILFTKKLQSYCQSSRLYERYSEAVTSSCDRAQHHSDGTWRHLYYATALIQILDTSSNILDYEGQETYNKTASTDCLHTGNANGSTTALDQSMEDTNTARSATGSTSAIGSSPEDVQGGSLMSSTTTSTNSSFSSSSSATHATSVQSSTCKCGQTLTGTSSASNLKRHQRTSGCSGTSARLECPEQGCNRTFTRSDNLRKHFRETHPFSTYVEVQRVRKKRKHIAQMMSV